jgi:Flp pilus assembly pilin Flp
MPPKDSRRFRSDEHGATLVEYGLMLALIVIVLVAGAAQIGSIAGLMLNISNSM